MQFKIIAGSHRDADGVWYGKDDVVESNARLDQLFKGKFEMITEPPVEVACSTPVASTSTNTEEDTDEELERTGTQQDEAEEDEVDTEEEEPEPPPPPPQPRRKRRTRKQQ